MKERLHVKTFAALAVLVGLTLSAPHPGFAQAPDELKALRQEIEALKGWQAAIQKELQEIKQLLRARPAPVPTEPQNVVLSVDDAPFKGDKLAKVTLIDFSDYQ